MSETTTTQVADPEDSGGPFNLLGKYRYVSYLLIIEVVLLGSAGVLDMLTPMSTTGTPNLMNIVAGLIATMGILLGVGAIITAVCWVVFTRA